MAKRASTTIPIVFLASIDPVAAGVAVSLARPAGNVTGFTGAHADLMGKRLELLRDTVPRFSRVVILGHAANPGNAQYISQADLAARSLGVAVQYLTVRDVRDFGRVFGEARGADGAVLFTSHRKQIVELAVKHHLPAIYGGRELVDAGGLMSYGPHWADLYRRAGGYIDRILKGAKSPIWRSRLSIKRRPTWQAAVSIGCAMRAAGR